MGNALRTQGRLLQTSLQMTMLVSNERRTRGHRVLPNAPRTPSSTQTAGVLYSCVIPIRENGSRSRKIINLSFQAAEFQAVKL